MKLLKKIASLAVSAVFAASIFCFSKPLNSDAAGESLSLSSAEGKPGDTVTINVDIACNNNFDILDAVVGWDDSSLTASKAVGTNVTSNVSDNSCSINAFNANLEPIPDGTIATIDFKIPNDAQIGTIYNINWVQIESFAIYEGEDLGSNVPNSGGTITVVESTEETPSLTMSSVEGKPGQSVTLDVNVTCNDKFNALKALVGWEDSGLKFNFASGVNGISAIASDKNDSSFKLDVSDTEAIENGTVAKFNFTIPENAQPGTVYNINWKEINSFEIFEGEDLGSNVENSGGIITVTNPIEQTGKSISLSSVKGKPGETVTIDIDVSCGNKFEAASFLIEWDTVDLKTNKGSISSNARGVQVTPVMGDDNKSCSIVMMAVDSVNDGTFAKIKFTIPEDVKDGTIYPLRINQVNEFYTSEGEVTSDELNLLDGKIEVINTKITNENIIYDQIDSNNDGNYDYLTVVGWDETATLNDVSIPNTVNGLSVTSIAENAFKECNTLRKIVIPENVSSIGVDSFEDCNNLTSITILNKKCLINGISNAKIIGYKNSTAETYARNKNLIFEPLDDPQTTSTTTSTSEAITSTTTVTSVSTTDDISDYEKGDANEDGKVNVRDCAYIANMISKGQSNALPTSADYNDDGTCNVRDAAALARDIARGLV